MILAALTMQSARVLFVNDILTLENRYAIIRFVQKVGGGNVCVSSCHLR